MSEILEKIAEAVNNCLGPLSNLKITGKDVRDLLIQLCATILLFVVVRIFFWKPITNILEKRREAMDQALEEAQASRDNAKALEDELSVQLAEAKASVKLLLDKAEKDANLRREQIISEAKEEAKRRLENLELELEQEKNSMAKEIRQEIISVAFAAAEKIVAKEIDQDKYMGVVEEILKGATD
ncbi:MAG: F0F1 ATP synthase subunit B [Anaeroplasmataceae bacterium]|nr:F0F1 ATP synthase subunit B [Anaeroplasmataceae bacterium]MDE5867738.1 F0F1 ATP synthase subunit B [Anaeroplasmataceae bacterium]MDE7100732.1 F0F1 ATP synthase subunit B [Anaeroplasmataceae bacterium]